MKEWKTTTTSDITANSCLTPRWVSVPNGGSVFAYQSVSPDVQWRCYEEERQCIDGILKWTYEFGTCNGNNGWVIVDTWSTTSWDGWWIMPEVGASCTTPRWQNIQHGNYIVSYESPSSCRFQRRMCVDWQLLWKFQYNYCMIAYRWWYESQPSFYEWGNSISYDQMQQFSNTIMWWDSSQWWYEFNQWWDPNWYSQDWLTQWSSWRYAPVYYGWEIANKTQTNDYWNQNAKWTVSIVKTSKTIYNPLATNWSPNNYIYPKDWRSNDYTRYDLTQKWCTSPWGTYIDHGQYVIAYKWSSATNGRSCEYERRNCFNGKLNGSFSFPSCTLNGSKTYTYATYQSQNQWYDKYYRHNYPVIQQQSNKSCRTPWGTTVKDGDYIRAYRYASAPYSDWCEWEIRYCHNGVMDWSYANQTCKLKQPTSNWCYWRNCGNDNNRNNSCSLPWGGTVAHGQSVTAYLRSNWQCYSQSRSCYNGNLNWWYTEQSCTPSWCTWRWCWWGWWNNACSLPWWGTVAHGQYITAYLRSNWQCYSQSRYCYNGNLNGWYTAQSCTPDNNQNSCSLPRWWSISHGQYVTAYKKLNWQCYSESRYCSNWSLNGSYGLQSCSPDNNQNSCSLPRWWSISHGQYVTAYKKLNWQCYSESRYCSNWSLNGSYGLQSCTPDNNQNSCSLPRWWSISHGQSVEAFLNSTSPCTKEIRTCNNWYLNWTYTYASCSLTQWWIDTYWAWQNAGWFDYVPDWQDSCHGDATVSFTCASQDNTTCVDYRKVENDCCIAWRAKYESRTVTCVQ